jgi:hypothetical protein
LKLEALSEKLKVAQLKELIQTKGKGGGEKKKALSSKADLSNG